jgi:DNA-binding response OmpR family regulator
MGYRALVIEDDHVVADVLRMRLQRDGHEVVVAANQRDAYHLLDDERFDFVLLDLRLPTHDGDMNPHSEVGFDTLDHIRERFAPQRLPVIVMTAYEETSQTAVRALKALANDYITKPFEDSPVSLDEKLAAIARAIEEGKRAPTARKHKLVFTRECVMIDGIVVANARYSEVLRVLGSRTLMLTPEARAAKDTRMKGSQIADAMGIEEPYVYKLVSRFRGWLATEFEKQGLGPLDSQDVIRNVRDWKGYELNFESCYITCE